MTDETETEQDAAETDDEAPEETPAEPQPVAEPRHGDYVHHQQSGPGGGYGATRGR